MVAAIIKLFKATPTNDLGGYDYEFVDAPPDTLVCKICHCPSKEPHLSVCCGHTFCKSCLVSAKNSTVAKVCPMCRSENFETFPNKQNERLIKSLAVFCTNKGKGCDWQGEVNDITSHLGNSNGCQFVEVSCSNNCGSFVQRQCLANHVENECPRRIVNCQYCHITGEHHFIENQHKKAECPKFPVSCPNECGMTIPRDSIVNHRKVCVCQLLRCAHLCGAVYQRKQHQIHVMECPCRKVRCRYCNVITEYNVLKQHYEQCPKLPLPCTNECSEDRIPRESMEEHRKTCPLEPVSCSNGSESTYNDNISLITLIINVHYGRSHASSVTSLVNISLLHINIRMSAPKFLCLVQTNAVQLSSVKT